MQAKLEDLEKQNKETSTPLLRAQLTKLRTELDLHLTAKAASTLQWRSQKYYSLSNKPTTLLAKQLKNHQNPTQPYIKLELLRERSQGTQVKSYKTLFSTSTQFSKVKADKFLESAGLPCLTDIQSNLLESTITQEEVRKAIKQLKISKAPGPDGFTALYYKKYAKILIPYLTNTLNEIMDGGSWGRDSLLAQITPIPKPDTDPLQCANYRPISIMNIDVKILSKILAERLNTFLPTIIDSDQVGFVPKRQASDNIRRALTFIHTIQSKAIPGLLVSIDLSKAFDSVSWPYLHYILERWGFKQKFRHVIKALYNNPQAYVRWGPYFTDPFQLSGGTRQGCPLSPILFILALEPLAAQIRNNINITGLNVDSTHHKLCLFADDILMLITRPLITLPNLIDTFNKFTGLSGLKINYTKTCAININLPPPQIKLLKLNFDFQWQTTYLKYLGVKITPNIRDLYKTNYPPLWKKVAEDLEKWSKQNISWIGRIHAVKMVILPQVLYYFRTLPIPIPNADLEKLQQQVMKFIWNFKPPRVSKATVLAPRQKGGLGAPNMGKYFQAAQLASIPLMYASPPPKWVTMEETLIHPVKLIATLWTPYVHRPDGLTPMLEHILGVWDKVKHKAKLFSPHYPAVPIIGNPEFQPGLNKVSFQWWEAKGLTVLRHMYGISGPLNWDRFQQLYSPPPGELFRFMQVQHYLKSKFKGIQVPPSTYLEIICTKYPYSKGVLSKLYSLLSETSLPPTLPYVRAWERDLGQTLEEKDWFVIWDQTAHNSINTSLLEAGYKVLLRWYLVPSRLHKINNQCDPQCFRKCGSEGTVYHIWWQCSRVQRFWTRVYQMIYSVTGINLPKSPEHALLGMKIPNINKNARTLINQIFTAAKLTIAKAWKSPLLPIPQLKNKINWILVNEKLTSILTDRQEQFQKIWAPWLQYSISLS
uniref:Reverse transcriptase domain-containing protein n=1 Tax=Xenopus tropicalis TaxID=8364 RepID=A0A803KB25_XENTR